VILDSDAGQTAESQVSMEENINYRDIVKNRIRGSGKSGAKLSANVKSTEVKEGNDD